MENEITVKIPMSRLGAQKLVVDLGNLRKYLATQCRTTPESADYMDIADSLIAHIRVNI